MAEIQKEIGADLLIYQDLEDLVATATEGNPSIEQFDCSVFNGKYVTGDINDAYLQKLEAVRNDGAKTKKEVLADPDVIDLHNAE